MSIKSLTLVLLSAYLLLTKVASGQTEAIVTLDRPVVDAGDSVKATFHLSPAPTFDGGLFVQFTGPDGATFYNQLTVRKGQDAIAIPLTVPVDAPGGTYNLDTLSFGVSLHKQLNHKPIALLVQPIKGLVRPDEATVALDLSQHQFLESKSSQLKDIIAEISTSLSSNSAQTREVKLRVAAAVKKADGQLVRTKIDYAKLVGKTLNPDPLFFTDFHALYQAALIDLNSPLSQIKSPAIPLTPVLYQLGKRVPPVSNFSGSLPLFAMASLNIMSWNAAVYDIIDSTGKDTFKVDLSSTPEGARISRRIVTQEFFDYSQTTNLQDIDFPLAVWFVRFEKPNCTAQVLEANPFTEHHPKLTAELKCSRK